MSERIDIATRAITAPIDGSVDFSENFTVDETVWAMVETKNGVEVFDGVGITGIATHFFYIRYIPDVTFEKWITFKNKKFNILDVQNLEERDEFYLLRCTLRGDETLQANFSR
jgi:SPP1 family predicted phage head-tail adaptor